VTKPSSEARLARALEELDEERRKGVEPDVERRARDDPEIASDLRDLWAMARVAGDAAQAVKDMPRSKKGSSTGSAMSGASSPGSSSVLGSPGGILPRLFGGYELISELGKGGMGIVYRARELELGREVALKLILASRASSPAVIARFRAEAEAAGRLEHPGIVPVYRFGEEEGHPYFTMGLIEGTTLDRRLKQGPLPANEAAQILLGVAKAIHHAHESGLLHRDLKPSNVLLGDDGSPRVTDFGLAKRLDSEESLTKTGDIVGTPCYMAPEQVTGDRGRITARTDVYGLGAILYHMLTGRPPFLAPTPLETVLQVLDQDAPPPRVLDPTVDRDLEMIALKCLQKPTELRYSSALEVVRDLEAYLAHEPVSARSGNLKDMLARVFRETHHAIVLENWGLIWILHSAVILVLCTVTSRIQSHIQRSGEDRPYLYMLIWCGGLGTWAVTFWVLRRRGGPVTFVERQIAHVWGMSLVGCILLFFVERLLGLPALTLSPGIALFSGGVFLIKAGSLSGTFYIQAVVLYLTSLVMASCRPEHGIQIFGFVSGTCFFIPGLKHYLRRRRRLRLARGQAALGPARQGLQPPARR